MPAKSTPEEALTPHRMTQADVEQLRRPFPAQTVGKLPKPVRRDDQDRGRCEPGSRYSADGHYCGGCHSRSVHLDYVGHAAVTERLLAVDPFWTWEPLAVDDAGMPALSRGGDFWIRLTVCGVTRLGVGDGASMKERIGDAIRNAAMRFGVALDLWAKEALVEFEHSIEQTVTTPRPVEKKQEDHVTRALQPDHRDAMTAALRATGVVTRDQTMAAVQDALGHVPAWSDITPEDARKVVEHARAQTAPVAS